MATAYRRAHHPIYHLLNILDEQDRLNSAQSYLVEDLPAEELYDLEADPHEINNLADDPGHQEVLGELRSKLETHLEDIGDQGLEPDSEQITQVFEEYGERSYRQRKETIEQLREDVLQKVRCEGEGEGD
jgi:uncharacterized sulfatase